MKDSIKNKNKNSNKRLEQEQEQEQDSRVARMQNHEVEVNSLRHECIEITNDPIEKVDACNERGALAACNEREDLELQEALLISQAHHNKVIFSATRISIREQGDLDAAISNLKAESLVVDAFSNS